MISSDRSPHKPLVIISANTAFFVHNFLAHFPQHFEALGWRVKVLAPSEGAEGKFAPGGFVPMKGLSRKGTDPVKEILFLYQLLRAYRRERPALVCHFTVKPNIYGSLACAILSIPSVSVVSGLGYLFLNKGLSSTVGRLLYRFAFKFPRKVYFLNLDDRDLFLNARLVAPEKAVHLPGTGIDAQWFRPGCVDPVPRPGEKIVFLMIARLLWDKGVREYFESAERFLSRNPSAEFWILGPLDTGNPSCVPASYLEDYVKRKIVRYHPAVEDVRPHIAASDVVVLPSYREGVPRSLLEAMAMEKPVIATDVPGCRDLIEKGKTGLLVSAQNVESLCEAFADMMQQGPDGRASIGTEARKKVLREFENAVVLQTFVSGLSLGAQD